MFVIRILRWNPQAQAQIATSDDMMYQQEWQYTPYNIMYINFQPIIGQVRAKFVCYSILAILQLSLTRHFGTIKESMTSACKICSVPVLHVIFPEMLEAYALVIIIMLVNIVDR